MVSFSSFPGFSGPRGDVPVALLLLGTMQRQEGNLLPPKLWELSWCFNFGTIHVLKNRGLSNKALLEWGCSVGGNETAFLPGQNECICLLELERCREPKSTITSWLQSMERKKEKERKRGRKRGREKGKRKKERKKER